MSACSLSGLVRLVSCGQLGFLGGGLCRPGIASLKSLFYQCFRLDWFLQQREHQIGLFSKQAEHGSFLTGRDNREVAIA